MLSRSPRLLPVRRPLQSLMIHRGIVVGALGIAACGSERIAESPAGAAEPPALTQMTTGAWHSCAIAARGSGAGPVLVVPEGPAYCWGRDDDGQLGLGVVSPGGFAVSPESVRVDVAFERLASGGNFTCGVTGEGALYCWGGGFLGSGGVPRRLAVGVVFRSISAGHDHACGITADQRVACWGANDRGQLGTGDRQPATEPVVLDDFQFAAVAAGGRHTCGLTVDEATYCWGANDEGQVGTQAGDDRLAPQRVVNDVGFSLLAAGGAHTCAMTSEVRDGGKPVYCWGSNTFGQLGRSAGRATGTPEEVTGHFAFRAIAAGSGHTCGIVHNVEFTQTQAPNNIGYCWGDNARGQSGTGSALGSIPVPDSVLINRELQGIAAGEGHTCAISGDAGFCWGANDFGQLGNGTTEPSGVPRVVILP